MIATGTASGLGLAAARQFANEGASLVLVDRAEQSLRTVVAELSGTGANVVPVVGDVSRAATAQEAVRTALSQFGRLDVLFNNAGIDPLEATTLVETTEEVWDAIVNVNVKSAYLFAKEAIPAMISGGGGAIVNTASSAGMRASARAGAYGISKAATIALTRSLARDFTGQGIRTNAICPGFLEAIPSDRRATMSEEQKAARRVKAGELVPLGREGTYEEVAKSVLFLASSESSYTSGAALLIDGGWIA
ncbi:SDR family NAD(P)-dependent oxidoreductase [Kribbella sp. CA-245084]|uniref:SDR family NAD(P)-dependent oxidoreductase n=1 Tax=Kribbella sp. CA-245084 TaxID=3239940 RepID=UPI003D8AEB25